VPEAAFIALLIAFPLIGLARRRWLAVLLAAIGWPMFSVGLNQGWWGHGTGDGWQYAAVLATGVAVVITAFAVAAVRAVRPRQS
jgi:hypothetical protein